MKKEICVYAYLPLFLTSEARVGLSPGCWMISDWAWAMR